MSQLPALDLADLQECPFASESVLSDYETVDDDDLPEKCLVCNSTFHGSSYRVNSGQVKGESFISCSRLQELLGVSSVPLERSTYLCSRCFHLVQDVGHLEGKVAKIKMQLQDMYTTTWNNDFCMLSNNMPEVQKESARDDISNEPKSQLLATLNSVHQKNIFCETNSDSSASEPDHPRSYCFGPGKTKPACQKLCQCTVCGVTLTSDGRLSQHMRVKHGSQHPCPLCSLTLTSASELRHHLLTHPTHRPFHCTHCPKTFQRREYLSVHLRTHTDERPYQCDACPKAFRSRSHLNNHRRIHTGQKPYVCQYCGKQFSMPQNLAPHLKTHTGKRGFGCSQCPKAFYTSGDLRKHERTHTGEKPYQCLVCGKCFASRTNCQTHERIHSKTSKVWSCEVCGKGFPRRAKLQAHAATHQEDIGRAEEVLPLSRVDGDMEELIYENEVIVPIQKGEEVEVSCEGQQMYVVEVFSLPSSEQ